MTPDRWKQVSQLFESALERDAAERALYLEEACGGDAALRREVESLIAAHEGAEGGSFMRGAAVEQVADTFVAAVDESPCEGETFGHYCIVRQVGTGGMGEVFLAEDTKPEHKRRRVALKLLAPRFMRDAERLRRFEQEAQAAIALNHPNVMTIYEIGEERGRRFIATEYIEGRTLREVMSERRLKLAEALDVATQVAAGLIAAHEAGIVHRDVKPENVMIRRDKIVKVLDFGLAKLTETAASSGDAEEAQRAVVRTGPGMVLGTVSYMSPEQSRGEAVDARTDVWSLGVVIYETVAGRLPFEGEDVYLQAQAIREQDPQPLALHAEAVPERLEEIVRKALAKDPEERYQTVRDLALDLQYLKRKLEVDAEVERALASSKRTTADAATAAEPRGGRTAEAKAATSTRAEAEHVPGRAPVVGAKGRRRKLVYALAAALLSAVAVVFWLLVAARRAPALTERDTIMLADFVNTTGDPVFDGTLKQALAVQLGQSPFLNIFSDERVREALKFMGRSPDERVTRDVARQICQRQGLKALLSGSISPLGGRYVITLEALAAETGDSIAREQAEADSKESVLRALGDASTRMRARLGESLQSIKKFDAPIEQATTPSLEALNAYSLGREKTVRGSYLEAVPFYKRAIELDPNFASAYWALGVAYANSRQQEPAAEAARKAFELRDRASERERLHITANYYLTTGEADRHLEALEVLVRTYPRDSIARNNLGNRYVLMGQHERAAAELREAITLNPNNGVAYTNLGIAFLHLNRFDEARAVSEEALAAGLDSSGVRANLFFVAFVTGDAEGQTRQLEWFKGKPDEFIAQNLQSLAALFGGRVGEYESFNRQCVTTLQTRNLSELAASASSHRPLMRALVGDCRRVREETAAALALVRSRDALRNGALAFALCGDAAQSQQLAEERARLNPQDTLLNAVWLPVIRAASEIERGDPASAVAVLEPARQYEAGTLFSLWPAYVRGLAHLKLRDGVSAAAEFRKIVERRGLVPVSVIYPLAHLGLARAYALSGDPARARTAYQDFFALWRDADPDTPTLARAREEYQRLNQ